MATRAPPCQKRSLFRRESRQPHPTRPLLPGEAAVVFALIGQRFQVASWCWRRTGALAVECLRVPLVADPSQQVVDSSQRRIPPQAAP
eukprot:10610874-Prorocentrum_lima.AAC.1